MMVEEVSHHILNQRNLILLCREYNWDPFFLNEDDSNFQWDHLSRELEACRAAGEWMLCGALVKAVKTTKGESPIKNISRYEERIPAELVRQRSNRSWLELLPGRHHLFTRHRVAQALRSILIEDGLEPQVFCFEQKTDFAEQWGLEMKHWNIQQKHELVVALGESASWLNLAHPEICRCKEDSVLAIQRANKQILLKAVQQSPLRSRSDYEKSILEAWILDPDCDAYLDMLRKVVAYRLRKKNQYKLLMEDFNREIVEFEVTKKLVKYLLND